MRWRADRRGVIAPDGGRPHRVAPTKRGSVIADPLVSKGRSSEGALFRPCILRVPRPGEALAGAMEAHADRRDRLTQRRRDLVVAQLLGIVEVEDLPLVGREGPDPGPDRPPSLGR